MSLISLEEKLNYFMYCISQRDDFSILDLHSVLGNPFLHKNIERIFKPFSDARCWILKMFVDELSLILTKRFAKNDIHESISFYKLRLILSHVSYSSWILTLAPI